MANQRLTDKTALASQTANDDLYMVVDTSDTTGSSSGTSKKVDAKFVIQTDIKTVNLDLNTTPLTLVPAPGAGHIIQPLTITFIYTYGTTSESHGNYLVRQRDFIKNQTTNATYVFGPASAATANGTLENTIDNKGLYAYSSIDYAVDGSIKAYVTYQIVKIT